MRAFESLLTVLDMTFVLEVGSQTVFGKETAQVVQSKQNLVSILQIG